MQLTELAKVVGKIINVLDSFSHSCHDGCTMLLHLRTVRAQVAPVRKVDLGLRISNEHPVKYSRRKYEEVTKKAKKKKKEKPTLLKKPVSSLL